MAFWPNPQNQNAVLICITETKESSRLGSVSPLPIMTCSFFQGWRLAVAQAWQCLLKVLESCMFYLQKNLQCISLYVHDVEADM